RSFAEPRVETIEALELVSAMLRDERIEGGALGVGRLALGEASVERFVKHPGDGGEGRSADRVQAAFILAREEESRGRRLAELAPPQAVRPLVAKPVGHRLRVRAKPIPLGPLLWALSLFLLAGFVVGAAGATEDREKIAAFVFARQPLGRGQRVSDVPRQPA